MEKKVYYSALFISLLIMALLTNAQTIFQPNKTLNEKEVAEWFKKRQWLNGLNIKPHKYINKFEFARQYFAHKEVWDKAFAYLKNTDLINLKPGKYPIDGENLFVTVAEEKSKEFEVSEWESHRKYQDIHLVIKGKAIIGTAPVSKLKTTVPYSNKKDVTFYIGDGKYYLAEPGTFFIFFPENAHRPNIKAKGYDGDKKIVVKIRTDL